MRVGVRVGVWVGRGEAWWGVVGRGGVVGAALVVAGGHWWVWTRAWVAMGGCGWAWVVVGGRGWSWVVWTWVDVWGGSLVY